MKVFLIIVLFSCFAFASCDHGCEWTGCEGKLRSGISICKQYGKGIYTGDVDNAGCKWDASKVKCCNPTPSKPGCKWTASCYGIAYSGNYVCNQEYGKGYVENDKLRAAGFVDCYECCQA